MCLDACCTGVVSVISESDTLEHEMLQEVIALDHRNLTRQHNWIQASVCILTSIFIYYSATTVNKVYGLTCRSSLCLSVLIYMVVL